MSNPIVNNFRGAAVLVTGGCGFIGSHLVENLVEAGARVTVLDNLHGGNTENLECVQAKVEIMVNDVRDRDALARVLRALRPSTIFHLAANASVPGSVEDPLSDFEANALGTFVVLDTLRHCKLRPRVLLASSGAVYGEPSALPITEHSPLCPISPYGYSKLNAEESTRMFHRVYGADVVIARLFNAYGPRMPRYVVLDFLRKLARDPSRLEILGTGSQVRDFTYVHDTVAGLLMIAVRGKVGEAYNLSSGKYYAINQLAEMLLTALNLTGTTRVQHTGQSWVGDAQRWEVSIDKIAELGYVPQMHLDDGLRETIRWFERSHRQIRPALA